ncbi:MAG: family 10 glycosylhydrolase [Bacillota bacterium]
MSSVEIGVWGGVGGYGYYPPKGHEAEVVEFVRKLKKFGVSKFFPTLMRWEDFCLTHVGAVCSGSALPWPAILADYYAESHPLRTLVTVCHDHGIEVHPYLAYMNHGSQWPNWESKTGEQFPYVGTTRFSLHHQEMFARSRDGRTSFEIRGWVDLSPCFPEARQYEIEALVCWAEEFNLDGIQLEFLNPPVDANGVSVFGYEAPSIREFETKTGRPIDDVPNDDPEWIAHRAGYTTLFLRELKSALDTSRNPVPLSVSVIAAGPEECWKRLLDWPTWIDESLVDGLYYWHRTADLELIKEELARAAQICAGKCRLIAELSCYTGSAKAGVLDTPELLGQAARACLACGIGGVGVYRADSIEKNGLWSAIGRFHALVETR